MSDRLNLSPSTRKKIEHALDKLIALLDACDPDPDLEPSLGSDPYGSQDLEGDTSDDEPSLGATEALNQERAWRTPVVSGIDLEFDGDTCPDADKEPDADGEPWLAGCPMDGGRDLELDPADEEPSLGATAAVNQERAWKLGSWWQGTDLEFDGETTPSADAEPSLGSLNSYSGNGDQSSWAAGSADDREGNSSDDEPSLGSRDKEIDQRSWHHGFDNDCELDTSDTEPSLGALEQVNQVRWAQGARDEREEDDEREWDQAEDGIADSDGLIEQGHGRFGERCE